MDYYRSFRFVFIAMSMVLLSACVSDIDPDRVVEQEPVAQAAFAPQAKIAIVTASSDDSVLWSGVTAIPNTAVSNVSPADYESGDKSQWAMIVFDAYQPKDAPKVPSIFFHSVPPGSTVKIAHDSKGVPVEDYGFYIDNFDQKSPLMKDVFPKDIEFSSGALKLTSGMGWTTVASKNGEPEILANKSVNGVPQVILAFKVEESHWTIHYPHDFPTFMTNAFQWMTAKP